MHGPEVLIPLTLFISVAITIIFMRKFLNEERLAAIEKGADPNIFKFRASNTLALKVGLLFIGVGLGILFGNILESNFNLEEEVAYFSMIFIFGGAGLLLSHKLDKTND